MRVTGGVTGGEVHAGCGRSAERGFVPSAGSEGCASGLLIREERTGAGAELPLGVESTAGLSRAGFRCYERSAIIGTIVSVFTKVTAIVRATLSVRKVKTLGRRGAGGFYLASTAGSCVTPLHLH